MKLTLNLLLSLVFVIQCDINLQSTPPFPYKNFTTQQESNACCTRCNLCSIQPSSCCGYEYSSNKCYYCMENRNCCYNTVPSEGFCCAQGQSCCKSCETGLYTCQAVCDCDFETSTCCGGVCCLKSQCCGNTCCDAFNTRCLNDKCERKAMAGWEWTLTIISIVTSITFPITFIILQLTCCKDKDEAVSTTTNILPPSAPAGLTDQFLPPSTTPPSTSIPKRPFFITHVFRKIIEFPLSWMSLNIGFKLVAVFNGMFLMFISLIGKACCDAKDYDIISCSSIPVSSIFILLFIVIYAIWFLVSGIYVSLIKGAQMTFAGSTSYNVGNMRVITTTVTRSSNKVFNFFMVLGHAFVLYFALGIFIYFSFNSTVKVCVGF